MEKNQSIHPFVLTHKEILFGNFSTYETIIEQIYTAIYVRVSSEKQYKEGTSIESQIYDTLEKAKELGIPAEMIRIYLEGGESGEDIDRPQMNRLRDDCERGFIKNIIITHPDRFSREMNGKLQVCSDFERNEVNLIFCDMEYSNSPEGKLFFNMLSAIAQYELEQIKRRTRKGIKKAVQERKQIQPMRVSPYGYDLIKGKFVKNDEAFYVQKIYEWYNEGLTMKEIGERLFQEGVMPKRAESQSWNQSTIQRILKNENYIGKYYYNRRKTQKVKGQRTKMGKPKKTYSLRESEDWWVIDDPNVVPPIIDLELFYKAQAKRLSNWKGKGQIKHNYLLAKLLYCDCCGIKFSPFTTQSQQTSKKTGETKKWFYRRYRCQNKNPRKYGEDVKKCPLPILHADDLEKFIWNNYIINTICDVELIKQKFLEIEEGGHDPSLDELTRCNKKLNDITDEKNRVMIAFQKGWKSMEDTDKEMEKLMNEEQNLKIKKEELEKHLNSKTNVKKSKEKIIESALEISEFVKNGIELSFECKKKIVNLLINEIIISQGKTENEIIIQVNGVLDNTKITSTIEKIKHSLNENNSEILRHPILQPQVVVNKDDAVKNILKHSNEPFIHKTFEDHKAYTNYIVKITFLTENGKKTKIKYRKSKFSIS